MVYLVGYDNLYEFTGKRNLIKNVFLKNFFVRLPSFHRHCGVKYKKERMVKIRLMDLLKLLILLQVCI